MEAKLAVRSFLCTFSATLTYACSCSVAPVNETRAQADVVFRGTIVALRPSMEPISNGYGQDTQKIAVFRVSRVWKGAVGPIFEMPATVEMAACWGFWPDQLKIGNDLLVYAFGMQEATDRAFYFTTICSRTCFANKTRDFDQLGPGHDPHEPTYLLWAMGIAFVAVLLTYIVRSRLEKPPARISNHF